MNILHITSGDGKYGSALVLEELIKCELKAGIVPVVVSPRKNEFTEFCDKNNIRNYVFYYEWSQIPKHNAGIVFGAKYLFRWVLYHVFNPYAEKCIEKIIVDEKIDVVHTNNMVTDIGRKTTDKLGINHIWHLRELLKENYNCYPIHRDYIDRLAGKKNHFIAISRFVKDKWTELGIDESRITVIYDGVDCDRFTAHGGGDWVAPKGKRLGNEEMIRFVMCGSYCKAKGQKKLIESLSCLDENELEAISLDLYGDPHGEYFEETRKLIMEKKLEKCVNIAGYSNNIPEVLKNYDCGIMCSENEAFGRVTIEYMLAGLCTILPETGANIELMGDGAQAIKYDVYDTTSLAGAIKTVIARPELISEYGMNNREYALNRFDINVNADNIIKYIGMLS